jgi:hypothetical protein
MSATLRPLRCLEFSPWGTRVVVIEPGHPEYEKLLRRNEEASAVLERHEFETKALKSFWRMLLWP